MSSYYLFIVLKSGGLWLVEKASPGDPPIYEKNEVDKAPGMKKGNKKPNEPVKDKDKDKEEVPLTPFQIVEKHIKTYMDGHTYFVIQSDVSADAALLGTRLFDNRETILGYFSDIKFTLTENAMPMIH